MRLTPFRSFSLSVRFWDSVRLVWRGCRAPAEAAAPPMRGGIRMKSSYQLQDSLRGKEKLWKSMILLKNCVVIDNLAARKLKELLGGSWTIENTKTEIEGLLRKRRQRRWCSPIAGRYDRPDGTGGDTVGVPREAGGRVRAPVHLLRRPIRTRETKLPQFSELRDFR